MPRKRSEPRKCPRCKQPTLYPSGRFEKKFIVWFCRSCGYKEIKIDMKIVAKKATALFHKAEAWLRANGFAREIDWCEKRPSFEEMNDRDILREYAYVVYNCGMRNAVIEAKWRAITKAFCYFNIDNILKDKDVVLRDVLSVFGHYGKADAVIQFAERMAHHSLQFRREVMQSWMKAFKGLAFIGDVTQFHLARNLGFDVIKPDRHLVRLAEKFHVTPFELCDLVQKQTGRRLGVIDVVFWRFCEQKGQTKLDKMVYTKP